MSAERFAPGEFIRDEMQERDWSVCRLAHMIEIPSIDLMEILDGNRTITEDIAHRLGKAFGTSAQMWLNLEKAYRCTAAPSK